MYPDACFLCKKGLIIDFLEDFQDFSCKISRRNGMIKNEIFRKLRAYYRVFCIFIASKYNEAMLGKENSFKDSFLL